jgi:uncharacterized repeat protein (TIGR03803 family)
MRSSKLYLFLTGALLVASSFVLANAQTFSVLYVFDGVTGQYPYSPPIQGRDGSLYGTTANGGAYGMGTVYRETSDGTQFNVIYNFTGSEGFSPSGLTLVRDGNFYGAAAGGSFNKGILFRITAQGALTVLYNFTGGSDGDSPLNSVVEATDGNLYGENLVNRIPSIYRYTPTGTVQVVYTFPSYTPVGVIPQMLQGTDGKLYAVNSIGGVYDCGAVTKVTLAGALTSSHSFGTPGVCYVYQSSGWAPIGSVIEGSDGNIYDTNSNGGVYGYGTIFKLDSHTGNLTVLHAFQRSTTDGGYPQAGLVEGNDGKFYGVTISGGTNFVGTVFQVGQDASYSVLYSMVYPDGCADWPLLQHTSGKFYSSTICGGTYGYGTLYSFDNGLGPFITFVRSQGHVGAVAQVLGQGLTGSTSVTFNGVPATSFSAVSDTYMTAVVPSGATTGPVVVTTPSGTLTSNVNFRISQ